MALLNSVIQPMPTTLGGRTVGYGTRTPRVDSEVWPMVVVQYVATRPVGSPRGHDAGRVIVTEAVSGETQTFSDGDPYTLLGFRDIDSITSLTADAYQDAVTGAPVAGPLVEGTDWDLAANDNIRGLNDGIDWLDGATVLPGDGATLTVDYLRNEVRVDRTLRQRTTVNLVVQAKDEATMSKEDAAGEVGHHLQAWVADNEGLELEPGLRLSHVVDSGPGPTDMGDSVATWVVMVALDDHRTLAGSQHKRVGDVEMAHTFEV